VIYTIVNPDDDFFPADNWHLQRYVESERHCSSSFFTDELERFRNMENPQKRGREFDRLMGLLFQQLPGVEIRLKQHGESGEVDVHMSCLEAPDWLYRLTGASTVIENKWEKDPIEKGEVIDFRAKSCDLPDCNLSYFVSMSGFSTGGRTRTGAISKLRGYENPKMVDFWEEDVEEMVEHGTPKRVLRERQL
jgi:hypothetical protein